jgi:hypothetical protein
MRTGGGPTPTGGGGKGKKDIQASQPHEHHPGRPGISPGRSGVGQTQT